MTAFHHSFQTGEPRLVRRDSGGWLALSDPTLPISIGTIGLTADDARRNFEVAVEAWRDLLAETAGVPRNDVLST